MKTIRIIVATIVILSLSGCLSTFFTDDSRLCIGENGVYRRCGVADVQTIEANTPIIGTGLSIEEQQREMSLAMAEDTQRLYQPRYHHKELGHYVEQLAMNLMHSVDVAQLRSPIAVTSFVQFDSTLNRADVLGNQLSELFFVELQQSGLPMVDFKVTPFIKVTSTGDFVFSRDVRQLQKQQTFGYVLSGTLVASERGVLVNARIIGLKNQDVVASAKGLIPSYVLPQY